MQVFNKSHINGIYDTMSCLNWLLQLFSLDSGKSKIFYKEKCYYLIQAFVTVVVFGAIDAYTINFKIQNMFQKLNITIFVTDLVQVVFDYIQYIVDIYFVYKYGREMSVEYFKHYECFDKILDIVNYSEIKKRLTTLVMVFALIWLISSVLDFVAWFLSEEWYICLYFSPAYMFMFIKILTNLHLTAQVINIECRLRVFGDIVQYYYNSADGFVQNSSNDAIKDCVGNTNWFYAKNSTKSCEMKTKSQGLRILVNQHHDIKRLTRCYLILTEQCVFISCMFGMRILLNSLSLLIDMVRFLNVGVRVAVGAQSTKHNSGYLPVVSSLLRLLSCVAMLGSLVQHCEQAYRQKDRISSIATHILINKNPDDSLRSAVTELRDLVASRPIVFNMAHFFILNYSFLMSMASVVVTYTIIMLQGI